MSFYIVIIALLVLIPVAIGIAYVARNASEKREQARVRGREAAAKKVTPVTLDRNPDMPHRDGATS